MTSAAFASSAEHPLILVVEDEPASMAILSAYFEKAGYRVLQAADGEEAWAILQQRPPIDLVVTDRLMPRLDGLALHKRMREDNAFSRLPVIMQTAATSPEQVEEGIKAGVYYYLTKPYQEQAMLALVESAIRDRKHQQMIEQRIAQQHQALGSFTLAEFALRTLEEAHDVSFLLGNLFPRPELAISGLYELIVNGIEHGNLGISYEEKSVLLEHGQWEMVIDRRLKMPEHASKRVKIRFEQDADKIITIITDEGPGFDWSSFLEIEPSRATHSHGRGIARANLICFDKLTYRGKGNELEAICLK